jgi:UPF0271 protein
MKSLDLNCDMGESFGAWRMGDDAAVLEYVSSVNLACGFHAGDPTTIRNTMAAARAHGVAVGAHPSLPDLQGFGRREMSIQPQEAYDLTLYQIGAVAAFARASGSVLHHVKPHGALYNMAAKNADLAAAITRAVRDFDPRLILYGLSGSELVRAGRQAGIAVASEVFADRAYQSDGSLAPRGMPNSLIHDLGEAVAQVVRMVSENRVRCIDGKDVAIEADTLCIHGDAPQAPAFARAIRAELERLGVVVRAPG